LLHFAGHLKHKDPLATVAGSDATNTTPAPQPLSRDTAPRLMSRDPDTSSSSRGNDDAKVSSSNGHADTSSGSSAVTAQQRTPVAAAAADVALPAVATPPAATPAAATAADSYFDPLAHVSIASDADGTKHSVVYLSREALQAGLRNNDVVVAVNGETCVGLSTAEVEHKIRANANAAAGVTLDVVRVARVRRDSSGNLGVAVAAAGAARETPDDSSEPHAAGGLQVAALLTSATQAGLSVGDTVLSIRGGGEDAPADDDAGSGSGGSATPTPRGGEPSDAANEMTLEEAKSRLESVADSDVVAFRVTKTVTLSKELFDSIKRRSAGGDRVR
jgi:membrane-associated protease RseP (regulator of RpoE activity)